MTKTIFGIYNETQTFNTLEEAENYLMDNYPERCTCKDTAIDFFENMIWEEKA